MTEQGHQPGTIGVISGTLARYPDFSISLISLRRHPETHIEWAASSNIVANLNAVSEALTGEWLWIMGDDHQFHPDTLNKLLDRDVDIVVPLVLRREPPFAAPVFKDDGVNLTPWEIVGGRQGLVERDACGNAGMLIRRVVLEKLGAPWWKAGQVRVDMLCEDLHFCREARALGFHVFVDTEVGLGHTMIGTVWPKWQEDGTLGAQWVLPGKYAVEAGFVTKSMEG